MKTWRLGVVILCLASGSASPALTDAFTYDLLGRVKTHQTPDGKLTTYSYDTAGNRTSVLTTATIPNRAPVAVDDGAGFSEAAVNLTFDPRFNDTDPDGQPITIVGSSSAQFGVVTHTAGTVTYTPSPGSRRFTARDSFTYTIQDSAGGRASAVVTIDLVNVPPIANPDTITVPRNIGADTPYVFDPRTNDSDPGGDAFVIAAVSTPSHGAAYRSTTNVSYIPAALYTGPDSFTYTVRDAEGAQSVATISVTVAAPANTAPIANDDFVTIVPPITNPYEFDPRDGDTDPDADPLLITGVSQGERGSVVILYGGQAVRYTASGSGSEDTFTYTISDGQGHTSTATVHVTFNLG